MPTSSPSWDRDTLPQGEEKRQAVREMFDAIADESDVIRAENQARHEQVARSKWTKAGRPPAKERARLAAERAKLAEMKPFRKTNTAATRQAIRRTLRAALNKAIAQQLITFNAAAHVELDAGARPKGLLWTDERVARWRQTGEKPSASSSRSTGPSCTSSSSLPTRPSAITSSRFAPPPSAQPVPRET